MSINFQTPINRIVINEAALRNASKKYTFNYRVTDIQHDFKVFIRALDSDNFIRHSVGTEIMPTPTVGYSDFNKGGQFTIKATTIPVNTDINAQYELLYYRDSNPSQLYTSGEGQALNINALKTQLDRIVMHLQESDDDFMDAYGRVHTIDTFLIPAKVNRAHKILAFGQDGSNVEMIDKSILTQISVNEADIANLKPRVAVNETAIANNVTNITTNTGDLSTLKARVTSNEAQKPIVSQAVANIEALQTVQTQIQTLVHANQTASAENTSRSMQNVGHLNSVDNDIVKLYERTGNNEILSNTNKSILQTHDNNIANNTATNNVQNAKITAIEAKNTQQDTEIAAHDKKFTAHDAKFTEIEGNVKDGVLKVHSAGGNVFDKSENVSGKFVPLNTGGPFAFQLLKPVLDTKVSKISATIKSDTTAPGVVTAWVRAGNVPGSGTSTAKIAEVDVTVNHQGIALVEFPLTTPITLTMNQDYYIEFFNKSGAVKNLMYDEQPNVTAFSSGWLYEQVNAGIPWNEKNTWSIKVDSNDTVKDAILGYDGKHLLINNSPVATAASIATDIARIDAKNADQDVLITINAANDINQNTSITNNTTKNTAQDARLTALEAKPLAGTSKATNGGLFKTGRDEAKYGNVGANAVDLSFNNINSSTTGATGQNSIAMGLRTTASGNYSVAQGYLCSATNIGTHASGRDCQATGFYASAFGRGCKAKNYATFASGFFNKGTAADTLVEIGNGASAADRKNAFEVHNNGICSAPELTLAELNTAPNDTLTTKEYVDSKASSGEISKATNGGLFRTGRDETKYGNVGENAVDLSNSDLGSTTGGATGKNSFAEGYLTTASGDSAHAEGGGCTSSGLGSHAEGGGCTASNDGAHAEGHATVASGSASHSEGSLSHATGSYTHAEGLNTIAKNYASHAAGQFNVGTSDDTIHETGNGTNASNRSNAFEIFKDGTITAPSATMAEINARGVKSLTTKEYVDVATSGIASNTSTIATNTSKINSNGLTIATLTSMVANQPSATPASITLAERDAITSPALGTTKFIREFNKVQRFNSYSSTAGGVWSGAEDYVVTLSAVVQGQQLIDSTSSVGEGVVVLGRAAGEADPGVLTARGYGGVIPDTRQVTGVITDKSNGYATVTTKGLVSLKVTENVNDGEYLHNNGITGDGKGCTFTGNANPTGAIGQFIESGQNGSLVKAILF